VISEKDTTMATRDQHTTSAAPDTEPAAARPEAASAAVSDDGAAAPAPVQDQECTPEALQEQLAQQRQQTEEYVNHLQRLQAEFQNYRRRVTQEKSEAVSRGKEDVLRALVPVLNNFRLALQHADQDANTVRQGVQMIWQQFEGFLRDQGVEPIPTVGQIFDPAYHEVLSTVPATTETPANTIVTEVKAGYRLASRLLAPAQVIVAQAEEPTVEETPVTSTTPSLEAF